MGLIDGRGLILAIDPATRSGVAEGTPGSTPKIERVDFGREHDSHADIFARALVWMIRRVNANRPALVVIEQVIPPTMMAGKTTFATSDIALGLRAIFLAVCVSKEIPYRELSARSWRAYCFGRGHGNMRRAKAKAAAVRLIKQMGWGEHGDDAAEAACIWICACAQVAPQRVHRVEPLFVGRAAG